MRKLEFDILCAIISLFHNYLWKKINVMSEFYLIIFHPPVFDKLIDL